MRAMGIEAFEGIDAVKPLAVARPVPQDDEVLIRVAYASLNPVDWKIAEGLLREAMPYELPVVLGWDGAGVVEAVGRDVTNVKLADEVFAYCRKDKIHYGTFAEYITIPAANAVPIPPRLHLQDAAAVPLAALTAWQALQDFAAVKAGDTVLITAGAGGVGSFAVQLAKIFGARVVATASLRNHGYLKELGADLCLDYNDDPSLPEMRSIAPKGVDVVFDCAGGLSLRFAAKHLKHDGRLVSIVETPEAPKDSAVKAGYVFVAPNGAQLAKIAALIQNGDLLLPHIAHHSLRDLPRLLEQSKLGRTRGKVVLRVEF